MAIIKARKWVIQYITDLMAQWLLRYLASLSNQVMSFGHVSSNLTEVDFFCGLSWLKLPVPNHLIASVFVHFICSIVTTLLPISLAAACYPTFDQSAPPVASLP